MAILIISRQLGSLGNEIAQGLADKLDYHLLTRDIISQMLQESGFVEEESIESFSGEQKPSFMSSFTQDRDRFLCYIQKVMYEFALKKDIIIMDMGGQVLFQYFPNTLRMRLFAPTEVRIRRIQEDRSCDERYAQYIIDESDQARAAFNKYYFDIDWEDIKLYDLIINTGTISREGAVNLIAGEIPDIEKVTHQERLTGTLNELVLRQRVLIEIIYNEKFVLPHLDVEVQEGIVALNGFSHSEDDKEQCEAVIRKVSGVQDVVNELIVEPALAYR